MYYSPFLDLAWKNEKDTYSSLIAANPDALAQIKHTRRVILISEDQWGLVSPTLPQ